MSVESYALKNGTIRWLYVFDLPREAGRERRQAKKRGFITETEAKAAETKARKKFAKLVPSVRGTLAHELREWVESRKSDLAPSSWSDYRYRFEAYVIPHIGAMPIHRAVEPKVISGLYQTLKLCGGKRGQGLAPTSVYGVHLSLMSALRDMGIDVSGIRSPRASNRKGRRRKSMTKHGRHGIWDVEQCNAFLAYTKNDRMHALWTLAIVCGLRRGELAGLRWRYVDLDNGVLQIRTQRVTAGWVPGSVYEDEPKAGSDRDIPLGPKLLDIMKAQRAFWLTERERLGDKFAGDDFVFISPRFGKPYYPGHISHRFAKLSVDAGLPRIALHDLRHSSASIGGAVGVDIKALQERMGHSHSDTLTNIYMHPLPAAARAASTALELALLPDVA